MIPPGNTGISASSQHGHDSSLRAVIYLRVSTKDQATRGGEAEGFSIPAQRDACRRKAEALGAVVIEEFVDRGESARSARRPELQRMLAFVAEEPVNFVIVHKVDRLARNRVDDVEINVALTHAGATLVSCTENIDETPSGILLHGIMSSIAEFYSRNLANEVNKGLIQKAKNGGTPFKAPIGYRPVRLFDKGREMRSVEIDPERAPLVKWAFDMYATGEWTTRTLLVEATEKGLLSRPTPKRPASQITVSAFQAMLRNPYYVGVVEYRGVSYTGKHEPIVDRRTFDEVQRILEAKNFAGEKKRIHHHYLKGSIWCGCCESRLIVCNAKSRSGRIYPYFVCIGRQRNRTSCTQRALSIDHVESAIESYYATVELSRDLRLQTEQTILEQIAALRETDVADRQRLVARQRRLLGERAKLLEAHYAGAIPLDLLKTEQDRIGGELATIEHRLAATEFTFGTVEANLKKALDLVGNLHAAYVKADHRMRRLMNQAIFERFLIDDEEAVIGTLAPPFSHLIEASGRTVEATFEKPRGPENGPRGLSIESLVVLAGLEKHAITGADHLDWAATPLAEADPFGHPDRLAVRMRVPGGPRARREVDAARADPRALGRRRNRVDIDPACEPVAQALARLDALPGDLHVGLLLVVKSQNDSPACRAMERLFLGGIRRNSADQAH